MLENFRERGPTGSSPPTRDRASMPPGPSISASVGHQHGRRVRRVFARAQLLTVATRGPTNPEARTTRPVIRGFDRLRRHDERGTSTSGENDVDVSERGAVVSYCVQRRGRSLQERAEHPAAAERRSRGPQRHRPPPPPRRRNGIDSRSKHQQGRPRNVVRCSVSGRGGSTTGAVGLLDVPWTSQAHELPSGRCTESADLFLLLEPRDDRMLDDESQVRVLGHSQ